MSRGDHTKRAQGRVDAGRPISSSGNIASRFDAAVAPTGSTLGDRGELSDALRARERTPAVAGHANVRSASLAGESEASTNSSREALFYLALGLVLAPAFAWLPVVRLMGWFLSSLVHEMGHSAASWLCGMPSVPAISLAGHAAAVHGDQVLLLALVVWAALAFAATRIEVRALSRVMLVVAVFGYPLIAFTPAREAIHLVAGHVAELAFSLLCLLRAVSGGFTHSRTERLLYSMLGWFLLGKNVVLTGGLVFSEAARARYAANGSFGLTNDYLRLSHELLGWPLEAVGLLMSLAALAVLPSLWILVRVQSGRFHLLNR